MVVIGQVEIGEGGGIMHLPGYGLIRVFKIVITEDDIEYWATNDLEMSELTRIKYANYVWVIENYSSLQLHIDDGQE